MAGRPRGGRVPTLFVSCVADWCEAVASDDESGGELATQHLVDLGHKRIVYFADPLAIDGARACGQPSNTQPTLSRFLAFYQPGL